MAQRLASPDGDAELTTPGQTATGSIQITSDGGSVFSATVYTGVNGSTDPELKQRLMEGTLNEIECPDQAGRIYRPALAVTYHDEEKEIFALVIPEGLRHQEFACRQELLQQLASYQGTIPDYMRRFRVTYEAATIDELSTQAQIPVAAAQPAPVSPPVPAAPAELTEAQIEEALAEEKSALAEAREELASEREKLDIDRQQLDEVASRIEGDSARVEETRAELELERQKLAEDRRKLQVQELNLEQERLRLQNEGIAQGDKPNSSEATQVVTDDQFIEVVEAEEIEEETPAAPDEPRRLEATGAVIVSQEAATIPETFDDAGVEESWFVETSSDLVVLGFSLDRDRAEALAGGQPEFLFQLHEVDDVPIIALTVAGFDDHGACVDAVAAPLLDQSEEERAILDQLARDLHLHIALYDEAGTKIASWEAGSPIRHNIGWARQRLRRWIEQAADPKVAVEAAEKIADGDVELVGTMHHPFETQHFIDFQGASDVKLAVGIVGYWSQPEQVDYLVGNRAFPLDQFQEIQLRVARQALHWGIAPGDALAEIAIEKGMVSNKKAMTKRLLANFAEICVGLRPNDLDPIEQWENWDGLIAFAAELGITPDPDVLELAEVSLDRAEEYEDMLEAEGEDSVAQFEVGDTVVEEPTGVVERRFGESGVTFLWPAEKQDKPDRFNDLMSQERAELVSALDDPATRLEAAQVLIQQFGADVVMEVLEASESMNAAEVAALAGFLEARADGLEGALMQALDVAGPSATLVAARGLAAIGSTAAMPRLLDAARDPNRRGSELANCLAMFGEKLVAPLSRELKKTPDDDDLVAVLAALERAQSGTLEELLSQRNKNLRKAAQRARQMV